MRASGSCLISSRSSSDNIILFWRFIFVSLSDSIFSRCVLCRVPRGVSSSVSSEDGRIGFFWRHSLSLSLCRTISGSYRFGSKSCWVNVSSGWLQVESCAQRRFVGRYPRASSAEWAESSVVWYDSWWVAWGVGRRSAWASRIDWYWLVGSSIGSMTPRKLKSSCVMPCKYSMWGATSFLVFNRVPLFVW